MPARADRCEELVSSRSLICMLGAKFSAAFRMTTDPGFHLHVVT